MRRFAFVIAILVPHLVVAAVDDPPAGIALQQHGHGWAITDPDGMTLYFYLKDSLGKSTCTAACSKVAPPAVAPGDAPTGDTWSVIVRDDGTRQWAYRGRPLYRSLRDSAPGDTNADEFNGLWRVAFRPILTPPGFGFVSTVLGQVLADQKQMTLYTLDKDKPDGSACDETCSRTWLPITAPALAHPIGEWSITVRQNGARQWVFRGRPLYRSAQDVRSGDTAGHTPDKGWRAVILEPPAALPGWVTLQQSDAGELLADAKGRTMYTFNPAGRGIATTVQVDTHAPQVDWEPVWAESGAQRFGSWVPVPRDDGRPQWSYRGLALFTNTNDVTPGDILGVRGSDLRFATIMRSGAPMQGIGQ